jgi:hypothetical protein
MSLLAKNRVAERIVTFLVLLLGISYQYELKGKYWTLDMEIRAWTFSFFCYDLQENLTFNSTAIIFVCLHICEVQIDEDKIILTSIRKAIFTQNKCPLLFMINDCNLCRGTKINLVNLSYQEKRERSVYSKIGL